MSGFLGLLIAIRTVGSAVIRITNRMLYRVPHEAINDILTVNGVTIAVGNSGMVSYSDNDGSTWTSIDTPAVTARSSLNRVMYLNNMWWALGSASCVMTSPDGVTWTAVNVTALTTKVFYNVGWNGSIYVISETNGIFTSPDGVTWTSRSITGYANFAAIVTIGNTFYMSASSTAALSTTSYVCSSTDGINWSAKLVANGTSVQQSTTRLVWNGSYFVCTFGTGSLYTSSDNVTWTQRTNPAGTGSSTIQDIRWLGDRWLGAYGGTMTSTDGVTWTATSYTNAYGGATWTRFSYTGTGTKVIKCMSAGSNSYQITSDFGRTVTTRLTDFPGTGHPMGALTSIMQKLVYTNSTYFLCTNSPGYVFSSTDSTLQTWTSSVIPSSLVFTGGIVWNGVRYVGGGAAGVIGYSSDGLNWTAGTSGAAGQVYLATGNGVFVLGSTSGLVRISSDGITWTTKTIASFTGTVHSVNWNGSQFIAMSDGAVAISTNSGNTWTRYAVTGLSAPVGLVWTGTQYVAAGSLGKFWTSPDGINWTLRTSAVTYTANGLAYNGSVYVSTNSGNYPYVMVSTDSINWSAVKIPTNRTITNVTYDGSKFIITGQYCTILTSTNGTDWSELPVALRGTNSMFNTDTGKPNTMIVADGTGFYETSDAGNTWAKKSISATGTIGGQVIYANGTYAVGAGAGVVYRSTDNGITWSTSTTGNTAFQVNGLAYNGNVWVATQGWGWNQTGTYRFAYYSYDLVTWYATSGSTSFCCGPVKWLNDRFVTWYYGSQPSYGIQYSTDGVTWASTASQNTYQYNDIAYGNGVWVAVGNTGYVRSSNDFVTWTVRTSGTTNSLYAVTFNGTYFLAVGSSGVAIMSADGANWSNVASGTSGQYNNVAWDATTGSFVVISSYGSALRLYP